MRLYLLTVAAVIAVFVLLQAVAMTITEIEEFSDQVRNRVTCTHFVEEDGSFSPVVTDLDGQRCLAQRGLDPEGFYGADTP